MSNLPEIGKKVRYQARRIAPAVVTAESSGAVMAYIPYELVNAGMTFSAKYSQCLVAKDGTPSQSTIVNLAKIFRLESPEQVFALHEIPLNEDKSAEFELADWYEDDSYTPEGASEPIIQLKPRWINPLGGGMRMPEPLDATAQKKLIAKFGGKFKAILANVDHKAAPATQEETPEPEDSGKTNAPPRKGAPPPRKSTAAVARTSTQEEVWSAYEAANPCPIKKPTKRQAQAHIGELGEKFWAEIEKTVPGKNGELSIEEWGTIADALGQ
jgi:hypothetical protein